MKKIKEMIESAPTVRRFAMGGIFENEFINLIQNKI